MMVLRTSIAIFIFLACVSCTKPEAAEQSHGLSDVRVSLQQHDFSVGLASLNFVTFDDVRNFKANHTEGHELIPSHSLPELPQGMTAHGYDDTTPKGMMLEEMLYKSIGKQIPDREFSPAELRALGVCSSSDLKTRYSAWLPRVVTTVFSYYMSHGKLPESGADLCEDIASKQDLDNLVNLSNREQALHCLPALNRLTGHLYDSFDNPEWSKGRLYVHVRTGEDLTKAYPDHQVSIPTAQFGKEELAKPVGVAEFIFFGEAPGSILAKGQSFY